MAAEAKASLCAGGAADFIPVRLAAEPAAVEERLTPTPAKPGFSGVVEATGIDIEHGCTRVRVQGMVDPDILRQVLGLVGRPR